MCIMDMIRKIYAFLLDTVQTFLIAASVFLVIYIFFFRPFEVNGASMYPTFKHKEYVLTNLISLRIETLKRGDVVVFKAPTDNEKDFIKRIIGLPNDRVSLRDGMVYVNGDKLDESMYLKDTIKTYGGAFLREDEEKIVPEDHYIVMGDNRLASSDSREWGFVKNDAIIGKSFFVYWPPNHAKLVKNPF